MHHVTHDVNQIAPNKCALPKQLAAKAFPLYPCLAHGNTNAVRKELRSTKASFARERIASAWTTSCDMPFFESREHNRAPKTFTCRGFRI
jgi:hypothetical protein